MDEDKKMYKETYFDNFGSLIKKLKQKELVDLDNIDSYFVDIDIFEDLSNQDIITYMLYCFEVIELTQKWKLKHSINYKYFLENMENIYDEIFCLSNPNINNKIIASTSFGNIIEKTINYGIDNKISDILNIYLKCIGKKRNYQQDNDLVLLRGNLYCQIYKTLLENSTINENCNEYLENVTKVFDYQKYFDGATKFFINTLDKNNLSYFELNNFLSFKTYNNCDIDLIEIKKIFNILSSKYPSDYFDKKIFIYLINSFFKNIVSEKKLNLELEIVFETKPSCDNILFLNYNEIDYNFNNNIDLIKNLYCEINNTKNTLVEFDEYLSLLKLKDDLILERNTTNNTVLNYKSMIDFISLLEFTKFFNDDKYIIIDNYFLNIFNKEKDNKEYFTDNELFRNIYSKEEIKQFIEKYPILLLEYDSDGNYKNIASLLLEKVDISSKLKENKQDKTLEEKYKTYEMLIKYRDLNLYSILSDYYSLLLIDSVDSNVIKEKEIILKEILPNLLKQNISFSGNIETEKIDEIYNDYINPCIKKISQNRVNNKSFDCTKDFLNYEKSNSDNYFGICKLQEILDSEKK